MKYWYKIICKMCGNTIRVEESKKVYSKEGAFLNLEYESDCPDCYRDMVEVWKKICDAPAKMLNTQQEEIGRFKYYIVLCQCTACNRYQLWILKELIKHE